MRTIRRLYFYLVALISLEVVLWGIIGLLRSMVSNSVVGTADVLARALALVLVGVPVFLFHWLWVQRAADRDPEEQTAMLRAAFFFVALGATLLPAVQNLLALLNRLLLRAVSAPAADALLGGSQTWADNLIAVAANLVVAAYLWSRLRRAWETLPDAKNFSDARRLYRYLWLLYGLALGVAGIYTLLMYLFSAARTASELANGLALVLVGAPVWGYTWRLAQQALAQADERRSLVRLGVLYLTAWSGAVVSLIAAVVVLSASWQALLGAPGGWARAFRRMDNALATAIPLGVLWAYYGHWLRRHAALDEETRAGRMRLYRYPLAFLGLGMLVLGLIMLLAFLVDTLVASVPWSNTLRSNLSIALSTLMVALPLWLPLWRAAQAEAARPDAAGEAARRSPIRRTYLYGALFVGVLGGMGTAVGVVFQVLRALLGGNVSANFFSVLLTSLGALGIFVVLAGYHLWVMRRDAALTPAHPVEADFEVLLVDDGDAAWLEAVQTAVRQEMPAAPLRVLPLSGGDSAPPEGRALLMSPRLALGGAPAWTAAFEGWKVVAGAPPEGWLLPVLTPRQAAAALRQAAEGRPPRLPQGGASSVWRVVQIGALVFVGLQVLSFLLMLLGSLFF